MDFDEIYFDEMAHMSDADWLVLFHHLAEIAEGRNREVSELERLYRL